LIKYNLDPGSIAAFVIKMVFFSALILSLVLLMASFKGISWTVIIVVVVTAVYFFILNKTKIGRHIYGMGGNLEAAKLSGVNTKLILIGVFISMGAMAGLSGIMITSRMGCAQPTTGAGFELDAIAACYIGGVSTSGGVGKVLNSVVGAFVIMSLVNGLNLVGVGISYQYLIKGIIFIIAVAIDVRSRGRKALG
jgi:putative multiple sugar transport system permease protein